MGSIQYEYGVQGGEMVGMVVDNAPEAGTLKADVNCFEDLDFGVIDTIYINSNNVRPCVREGGFRDC